MIARVIVEIRDERVEADSAEQFAGILLGVFDNPAQFFDQDHVGPVLSRFRCFIGAQDRQAADHARASITFRSFLPVEALDEQHILAADRLYPAFCGLNFAFASQPQHGVLDPSIVPAVVVAIEFCYPKAIIVLHYGLRASAAHRRAEQH